MTRLRIFVLALMLPAALVAQQAPVTPPKAAEQMVPLDRIVAMVGDDAITFFDLQEYILQQAQATGQPLPTDSVALVKLQHDALQQMVDEQLLLQKAKELKIDVPDADISNSVDRQMKDARSRFETETEYRSALAKAGLGTPEEYRKFLTDQMRRTQTIQRTTRKLHDDGKVVPANVTEAEVKEAFERNKAQLPRKEPSVTFRQIVIAPKPSAAAKKIALAKAETLLAELKRGADFAEMAKRESMDVGSKPLGGDLGWQRFDAFVPEFARWVYGPYAIRPGDLSPVVETPFGYHIIRLDRVNGAEVKARHILIRPIIDSTDIAETRHEADSVLAALQAGANFDSLAKKHHDYADKEETSLLTPYPRSQLPADYQKAFIGKKAGDIMEFPIPVPSTPGVPKFVVCQLVTSDAGGEPTLNELRQMVHDRLAEEGGMRRYLDTLRKQTYVSIRLDQPTKTAER